MNMLARAKVECNGEGHYISVWEPGDEEKCGIEHVVPLQNGNLLCYESHYLEIDMTVSDLTGIKIECLKYLEVPTAMYLYQHIKRNDIDMVHLLLHVYPQDRDGLGNALITAVRYDFTDIVKLLVEHGADATYRQNEPIKSAASAKTATWFRTNHHHTNLIRYLMTHGANIKVGNDVIMRTAASRGDVELVKFAIKHGANVNAQNGYALIQASKNGRLPVVRYLVTHGADVTANNNQAIVLAAKGGYLYTVQHLLKHGASLFGNQYRESPLVSAVRSINIGLVIFLLKPTIAAYTKRSETDNLAPHAYTAIRDAYQIAHKKRMTSIVTILDGPANKLYQDPEARKRGFKK
jgi:ankyrin repeat protein